MTDPAKNPNIPTGTCFQPIRTQLSLNNDVIQALKEISLLSRRVVIVIVKVREPILF